MIQYDAYYYILLCSFLLVWGIWGAKMKRVLDGFGRFLGDFIVIFVSVSGWICRSSFG